MSRIGRIPGRIKRVLDPVEIVQTSSGVNPQDHQHGSASAVPAVQSNFDHSRGQLLDPPREGKRQKHQHGIAEDRALVRNYGD